MNRQRPSSPADTLLLKARRGDRASVGPLLDQLRPYLLAVAQQELGHCLASKTEAEDLVQETVFKAFRTFAQFEGTTAEELRGWLRRILLNRRRDTERHWRRDRRQTGRELSADQGEAGSRLKDDLAAAAASPMAQMIRQEKIETVHLALELLNAEHRDVIVLHWQESLPFAEVGPRLKRSADAARKLWERALVELKRRLQEMREGDSEFRDVLPPI